MKIDGGASIAGTYNVSVSTTKDDSRTLTFTDQCTVVNYGPTFDLDHGTVHFNAMVGHAIHFDSFTLGESSSHGGTAWFNSGDPVDMDNLHMNPGTMRGASDFTINTSCFWGSGSHFRDSGVVNVNGTMTIASGSNAKTLADRALHIRGATTMAGGFGMTGSASLHIHPTGVLDIQFDSGGSAIGGNAGTPITNEGMLTKTAGSGISSISAPVTSSGIIDIRSGTLEFSRHRLVQTDGQIILNGGTLATWNSNQFGNPAIRIDGGVVTGSGLITDNFARLISNPGGTFAPGSPTGLIHITGRYTQGAGGTLEIELEGSLSGEYDVLETTGVASLAGELHIIERSEFKPAVGNTFAILTAASVTGQFDNVVGPAGYEVQYNDTDVTLVAVPIGDFDGDGVVGLYDYWVFQRASREAAPRRRQVVRRI